MDGFELHGVGAVEDLPPVTALRDESDAVEDAEVLGERGLGEPEALLQAGVRRASRSVQLPE